MGGLGLGETFINNVASWEQLSLPETELEGLDCLIPDLVVAPMTGVEENMGNPCSEAQFHFQMVAGAKQAGILSSIGDGVPDFKLQSGAEALRKNRVQGAVFLKPYPNSNLFKRYEWVQDVAQFCGVDIDAYQIVTMKGKTVLEKKSAADLIELKQTFKVPFVVKGVATEEEIQLVEAVKPDVVVVSNHGGRVSDHGEGIAFVLHRYADRLRKVCGELWVDGGIRSRKHCVKAGVMGAKRVLIGRPFIQGTLKWKEDGVSRVIQENYM